MLKLAICDDDGDELSYMSSLIEEFRMQNSVEYEYTVFHSGIDLVSMLEKGNTFDIYFLDIIMPSFTGIALAKEIRTFDKSAQIIFLTCSSEFALDAYLVKATNYVVKPITKDTLFDVLTDVLERIEKIQAACVVVKSNEGMQKIFLSNLVYVEAMGKKVVYHVVSGRAVQSTAQFSAVCEHLIKDGRFIKSHRSYLVNMSYIDAIGHTEMMLQTSASIPIAQGKAKEIKERYLAFQMEED